MKKFVLFGILMFLASYNMEAQTISQVNSCFNGDFSLEDPECAFLDAPLQSNCGPIRYYLPSIWRNIGLDVPASLFIYTPFDSANVRIFTGDGLTGTPTFESDVIVTSAAPIDFPLSTNSSVSHRVQTTNYNSIEDDKGLIIESDVPITVVYKLVSNANQSLFVLKGDDGLGHGFMAASQTDTEGTAATVREAHFVSVMATQDNTTIQFSKDGHFIEGPNNNNTSTGDIDLSSGITISLDAGETYLIRDNVSSNTSVAGILVTADKPISVVSGSSHTRHASGVGNDRDAGMDNLIPLYNSGTEYIAIRGDNRDSIDYLIIIGSIDDTPVNVNGTDIGSVDAGGVLEYKLPGSAGDVFFIESDELVNVYHVSGTFDEEVGMAQLPSLEDCSGNSRVVFPLIGPDEHIVKVIIPQTGLVSLQLNGSSVNPSDATNVPGTNMSVVTFDEGDLNSMSNTIVSDELFHVGITTGNSVGGSYGYITRYGNGLILYDPNINIPVDMSSFSVFVAATIASTTGFSQDIGVVTCNPPVSTVSVNGDLTSPVTTSNGGTVTFSGTQIDYTSSSTFIGFDDIEVMMQDASGARSAVCLQIGVFRDEVCGNNVDDDLDGSIDEIDECPIDLCDDCDNAGCSPVIFEVVSLPPTCSDVSDGGIAISSPTPDVEYSIDGGLTFQNDASFFDLPNGTYEILVRNTENDCETEHATEIILAGPICDDCRADAGDPRDAQSFCKTSTSNSINVSVAPNTNTHIPSGYEVVYVLTKEPNLVIVDYKINTSNFRISEPGNYRIHTLIAEVNNTNSENFLDLSIISKNQSTLIIIIQCISNHGVCAALDTKGSFIQIFAADDPECQELGFENTIRKCFDGFDNDSDGLVDCLDPDCQEYMICQEDNSQNCNDGIDNDNDGLVDCLDDDCYEFLFCAENGKLCNDGIDNDGDGLVDCDDPDCVDEIYCVEDNIITCCDGIDNDGDGLTDCDEPACAQWLYCREHSFSECTDGIDNDLDGLVDCADPNCQLLNIFSCRLENNATNCNDGIDNDEDGLLDCLDDECSVFSICDADGDGLAGVLDIDDSDPCIPINSSACDEVVTNDASVGSISFDLRVFLEGPYNIEMARMKKRLNEQGYLPGQKPWTFFGSSTPVGQPYNVAPWYHSTDEGESYIANTNGTDRFAGYPQGTVDWVLISLRQNPSKASVEYKVAALLQDDGSVIIPDGFGFENPQETSYYVVIEHRNHMPIRSENMVEIIDGTLAFDFTSSDSYTSILGSGQIKMDDGKYAMIAGNSEILNANSSYTDLNINDLNKLTVQFGANSGYYTEDLDLDGDVNTRDKSVCLKNNGLFCTLEF